MRGPDAGKTNLVSMILRILTSKMMVCGWFGTSSAEAHTALPVECQSSQVTGYWATFKCVGNCSGLSVTRAAQPKCAAFQKSFVLTGFWNFCWFFSPKSSFTDTPYGLQEPTNSGQPMTSQTLVLLTLAIQAVLAGATLPAIALCAI